MALHAGLFVTHVECSLQLPDDQVPMHADVVVEGVDCCIKHFAAYEAMHFVS